MTLDFLFHLCETIAYSQYIVSWRFEIPKKRTIDFLNSFKTQKKEIIEMIEDSFLSDEGKARYISLFEDRLSVLK